MSERMDDIMARLRRQRNDDHWIEAKSGTGKLDTAFWKAVSAFANTKGGLIVLGIEEDQSTGTFQPATDFDSRAMNDRLISALRVDQQKPPVTPIPETVVELDEYQGSPVILVEVRPMRTDERLGKQMPCYVTSQGLRDGAYKRVLDGDQRLSSYEIFQLMNLYTPDSSELLPVPGANLDDLDGQMWNGLIQSLEKRGSRIRVGTRTDAEVLERLHVLDAEGVPTLAGALALGSYPQQFFPQLFIDVAVHPTTEKSTSETRFLDRAHCDGPLPLAVEDAIKAVVRNLRVRTVEVGSNMVDEPEIPEIALREAIVNAAMHRDYSPQVQGRQVQVDVYPDRVEVNSPGGLWGDRTEDNIDENRSVSRNPSLANLLSNLPTPSGSMRVAENQGSGIQRMKQGMEGYGLPQPVFDARIGEFTVILYRFGILDPEMSAWLESVAPNSSREEQIALAIAKGLGAVSVKELRKHIGLDSDDARSLLSDLVTRGLLGPGHTRDSFVLSSSGIELDETDNKLIAYLAQVGEAAARDIADHLDVSVNTLRPRLRSMVDVGEIVPTAPPTSRKRKYRLPN
ncbi:ATP-binding protein [Corynebacterium coyleae]|uniref:DNA binding domain-containing protein n=1 Tax=Corynebacterium coyleae TaxID=53374 RepID=A0ABX8KX09_9CORY|nr:ATP-binding protein [Corynebacterium coyleae]MDK8663516.1 ATP-binding protein [Corynebacterium coyleae]MDK8707474.1 ATP-binding protein [Corynebacterium coyleae]MDK8734322.1 ATP-binding protein [Corynebacterium coyleae]MDK8893569.1 ATP-binding protein [Corynebacterium coyleae]QXB19339.1 putative DNA binding domain-containing protein [Corynebacterium coyleae]